MTDAPAEPANDGQPTVEQAALAADASTAAAAAASNSAPASDDAAPLPVGPAAVMSPTDERPELAVGAAFVGGLALALLLKRLAR
jgi:hypothetical protein